MHDASPEFPAYTFNFPERCLCQEPVRECWLNQCSKCKDGAGFKANFTYETSSASWYVWRPASDTRLIKTLEEGTTEELAEYIRTIIPQFLQHCFVKRHQAASYNEEREKATSGLNDPTDAVIQIDFSENYTCVAQDEIQSAHWNQRQVSLFTVATWHSGVLHSSVVASDNIVHSKDTVIAYMDLILGDLPDSVKSVSIWSDGPASQFKNRYIAASIPILKAKHKLNIIKWNFLATSHGKGPVDGIGGSVKRHVWMQVKTRKSMVYNAATFVEAASEMPSVSVTELQASKIEQLNISLDLKTVFEKAKPIVGIASKHLFRVEGQVVVPFLLTEDDVIDEEDSDDDANAIQIDMDDDTSDEDESEDTEEDTPADSDTSDESPSSSSTHEIRVGEWYAVEYQGIRYPGEVVAIGDQNDYQVSVMQPAGQNWKWPKCKDTIYYAKQKLVMKLDEPNLANNRCHYKFSVKF